MSNTIYVNKSHHYVYQITEVSTNRKYIGVRTSKIQPDLDLGVKYFSSSLNKEFIQNQKTNPSNYIYEILSIHDNRLDAVGEEIRLHILYDVSKNPEFINKSKQTSCRFDTSGHVLVVDKYGNTSMVLSDDPRYLNGDLVSFMANKTTAKDTSGIIYSINIDDPRLLSGELVGVTKGYAVVRYKNEPSGKKFLVGTDDPRYISGELVHINTGRKLSDDHKNKISPLGRILSNETKNKISNGNKGKIRSLSARQQLSERNKNSPKTECQHCHKKLDNMNFKRWHGDKCKMKKGD